MRACWLKWVGRDWSISADYIWLNYSGANSGGAEAVIRNGENGILVDIDDDLAECEALNKIVEDKSYSNHLSNNALMLRQSLSLETIGNEWANLLFK